MQNKLLDKLRQAVRDEFKNELVVDAVIIESINEAEGELNAELSKLYAANTAMRDALEFVEMWMRKRPKLSSTLDTEIKREAYDKIKTALSNPVALADMGKAGDIDG